MGGWERTHLALAREIVQLEAQLFRRVSSGLDVVEELDGLPVEKILEENKTSLRQRERDRETHSARAHRLLDDPTSHELAEAAGEDPVDGLLRRETDVLLDICAIDEGRVWM